jgi:multidrug efflux pump subunit AcrA (membrane-fusion protein)
VVLVTVRRRLALTAAALAAVALAGRGIWGLVRVPPGSVRVERGDLVVGVEITGTLRAVESSVLGPPQIRDLWQFKIAMMADEGTEVSTGDPVLGFDPSELQQRLQTKLADLDSARTEVEKMRVDLAVTEANDRLALAEVEARLRKARLIAAHPPELHSSIELGKARLDLELAELEVELVRQRIDATRRAGEEELGVLEASLAQVTSEVQQLEDGIGRMQRTAPRDGIVIHVTDWRNEKRQVGDTCWVADPVVEIPDLTRMEADGEVEEAQAGRVREGQSALLRLDAHPDREYAATVHSLSRAVQEKSWRNPKKIVRLTLSLEQTDPERMRPGMRFRGTVEIERRPDAVLLPVAAVFADRGDTVVYRRGTTGWRRTPVELGERTTESVEVLGGVAPGDLVSLRVRP